MTEVKVLSLGAGVNSTALLVLKAQGKVDFDLAIFADTGGENPETYRYLEEVIKPFCEKYQIPLSIVKREGDDLYQDSWNRKIIPARAFRSCTDKFKIRVIRKFLLKNYPNEQIVTLLGFCKGEEQRQTCDTISPLIELGIDRKGCIELIKEWGLPIPIKSGCYFCPFTRKSGWLSLLKNHPDLYAKAEQLEKNGSRYPEFLLSNIPLEKARQSVEDQQSMCSWLNTCSFCEVENNEAES